MLVQCPQCSAAYEFPAERLPEDGLRAKCARCGCIMRVRPPAADGQVRVEANAAPTRRPGRALGETARAPSAPRVLEAPVESAPAVAPEPRSTTRRAVEEAEDEPSIIIDMGQLNEGLAAAPDPAPATAPEAAPDTTALTAAPPVALFAPFAGAAAGVDASRADPGRAAGRPEVRHRIRTEALPVDTGSDAELVAAIRPKPVGRMVLAILVFLTGGFLLFVAWRNDFGPVWEDPQGAVRVALGLPAAAATAAPAVPLVEETAPGELVVRQVELEWLDRTSALLRGLVVNESNRIQRSIGIEVGVAQDGLPLRSRVVPCCAELTREEALKIARDSGHPHFADGAAGTLTLAPTEAHAFTAVIRDLPAHARDRAEPLARIRYSEADRLPGAPR